MDDIFERIELRVQGEIREITEVVESFGFRDAVIEREKLQDYRLHYVRKSDQVVPKELIIDFYRIAVRDGSHCFLVTDDKPFDYNEFCPFPERYQDRCIYDVHNLQDVRKVLEALVKPTATSKKGKLR